MALSQEANGATGSYTFSIVSDGQEAGVVGKAACTATHRRRECYLGIRGQENRTIFTNQRLLDVHKHPWIKKTCLSIEDTKKPRVASNIFCTVCSCCIYLPFLSARLFAKRKALTLSLGWVASSLLLLMSTSQSQVTGCERTEHMHIPRPSILTVAIFPKVKIQRIVQRPSTSALCVTHFRSLVFLISVLLKTSSECAKEIVQASLWHYLGLSSPWAFCLYWKK